MTHDIIQPKYPRVDELKRRLEGVRDPKDQLRMALDTCYTLEDELACAEARLEGMGNAITKLRSAEAALYELPRVVGSRDGTPHEIGHENLRIHRKNLTGARGSAA